MFPRQESEARTDAGEVEAAGIEPAQDSPGYVYLIADGDRRVKIGYTRDPLKRLRLFQVGNANELELLGTYAGTVQMERDLHELFARWRIRGEWYAEVSEITDHFAHRDDISLTRHGRKTRALARLQGLHP